VASVYVPQFSAWARAVVSNAALSLWKNLLGKGDAYAFSQKAWISIAVTCGGVSSNGLPQSNNYFKN
jgi:hypothetical protein